jgi:hypothetical protein
MPSENTIYFYPGRGGHSHDGNNSSFIDTSVYSLFDFSWGEVGDPDRRASQRINYNAFRDFVITTVNGSILEPSGLVLQPGMVNGSAHIISRSIEANTIAANTLTANEISANTITSNELAANFVLVNTIIASSDFNGTFDANTFSLSNTGTDGWAITSAGDAVFTNGLFRGNLFVGANDYWYSNGDFALGGNTGIFRNAGGGITLGANVTILGGVIATSVATPGIDIDANGNLTANTFALFGNGAIVTSSGNFSVDASGNLYAENADIAGTINSTSGSIAGWTISNDTISAAGGDIYLYQEPGYGSVNAGSGAGQQIYLNSDALLHAEFSGVTTDINFQTDTAYVFRITDGSQFIKIAPLLVSAQVGASYSFLANDMIATTGEVSMDTASVNGIGIMYPGCTTGPGAFNYMGLVWDNPNIRGTVDNAVSAVLGTVSDIRSKVNIIDAPSDWALKTLNDLRVVEYNPIDILNPDDKTEKPKRLGLIAQELADVFPELVTSVNADDPDAILSVDYLGLVPHLIQVIKLLNDKIESIEQRIGE